MTDAALERTFRAIGEAAPDGADDWWVIGSAALVLAGVEGVEPDDVDLIGARATILRFLACWGVAEGEPDPHGLFNSSPYLRVEAESRVPIETMGDLHVFRDGSWMPLIPRSRIGIDVAGTRLFIPALAEQRDIFRLFGRPKDMEKARLVEAYL